jgi:putative heme-binding domain-containing protein
MAFLLTVLLSALAPANAASAPGLELRAGDRVVLIGDALIEREQQAGWIELMLTTRFPDRDVTFRNLGWGGDTPAGDSRFGLSLLQAGREPADEGWNQLVKQIEEAKPTVVFIGYGMASSFAGESGLGQFKADYGKLLGVIRRVSPDARVVLLPPIPHENLGAPWPNPEVHNAQLALYGRAVAEVAEANGARFVPLFDQLRKRSGAPLTSNGIHLTAEGYRVAAEVLEDQLFGSPGPWRRNPQAENLRRSIVQKNEWFFHRSRPANMAYIFGFRKKEQGRNATEVLQFETLIANEEKRIAQLRALGGASVPEIPRHVGNVGAKFTPQPHPQFEVAEGLEVTLWAENPLLNKPIQMNFDARGRLWVASSELYPQIEPGQAATDKIIVLEDTSGSGRADKATVFADGLLIPTGVEPGDGGVYVAQSTELLFFQDSDGDGRADVRRTVLSGFGTEDTHHNLHTLHWGPDGRLYMNQSVYTRTDAETPHGVVRLKAGGIFRFDPRNQAMSILYRGWVNAWGHQFDAYGQSFVTDGAGFQGVSWAVDGATYFTLAPYRRTLASISPGAYPKFAGLEIVRSTHFPADWQGDMITSDFRAHRVVRFKASDQGAGYVTKEMPDLMRTTADSFRPIDVKLGPDGALYVADWSNPIIQHGEVDFRDSRRDKAHGRIWRIAAKGRAPLARTDLTALDNRALFGRLVGPNAFDQEKATRVLVERGAAKVLPDLDAWTATLSARDELGRLRALSLYQAFDRAPEPLLNGLLAAKDPNVRAVALRALPASGALTPLTRLAADPHPRVRLEAVRALGRQGTGAAAAAALSVLGHPMDPFIEYALWLTINELAEPWIAAVKSGSWSPEGREPQLEFALKSIEPTLASGILGHILAQRGLAADGRGPWIELIGLAGGPREAKLLLDALRAAKLDEPASRRAVAALTEASRLRNVQPEGGAGDFESLLALRNGALRTELYSLAGAWKLTAAVPALALAAGDAATVAPQRTAALAALRDIGGPAAVKAVQQLSSSGAPEVRRSAVITLAALNLNAATPAIITLLRDTKGEAELNALWRGLLGIRGVSARLAEELAKVEIPVEAAKAGLRPAREGNQHAALVPALVKAAGLTLSNAKLSPAELQQLARESLAKGDAARGEWIYRRTELACTACHAIGGAGGKIGPDLTSIGASAQPDYLVESLLYPNAKVKEGYHAVSIGTKSGQDFNGMIVRETETELLLRDAAGQEVSIPARDVNRRTNIGSLMPAGLIDALPPEERADLVAFLAALGRPGAFDAAKGGVARTWNLYLVTARNEHVGVERVVQGNLTLADWVPALSLVDGRLPKEASLQGFPALSNNRGLFAATQFNSPAGGRTRLQLSGPVRGAWLNGALVKVGTEFSVEAKPGANTLVVQLDDAHLGDIRLTSPDASFVTR